MDSYFYLRKAEEMAESGRLALSVNRNEDPLTGAEGADPNKGISVPLGISALAYLVWKYLLNGLGVSLTQTAIWMGPALGSLAVVPAFLYAKKRTGLAGGIAAGLLVGCAIPFVIHTHAGFFDTDMVLAVLPLTALTAHMRCLQERSFRKQAALTLLSAAALAATALCWRGFSGYWWLAAAGSGVCVLLSLFLPRLFNEADPGKGRKQVIRGSLLFLAVSLAVLLAAGGTGALRGIWNAPADFRARQDGADAMPYALALIQEMQPQAFFPEGSVLNWIKANTASTMGRMGGTLPLLLALLCIPLGFVRSIRPESGGTGEPAGSERNAAAVETVFLGIWLAAGIWLACTARRYAEIAALPVCLLGGMAIGRLFSGAWEMRKPRKAAAMTVCTGLLICTAALAGYGAWRAAENTRPMLTDSKHDAMAWIRENTPEDTVIASWWDDGYYMQYRAGRRTLADGGSDSGATDWFLAKALLTHDPQETAGILRMLGKSGTEALEELTGQGMDQAEAAGLLERILPLPREEAQAILRESGAPGELIDKTHPEIPGPTVLALSSDLMVKCRALGYYAFWDPGTRTQSEEAFATGSSASASMEAGRAELAMSNTDYTVSLETDLQGRMTGTYTDHGTVTTPGRICVWEDGVKIRDERLGNDGLSLVAVKENGRFCAVLCTDNLCDSMLVRLLLCGDRSLPQARLLGTWYGRQEAAPCPAQSRIAYNELPAWSIQVWQIQAGTNETNGAGD